MLQLDSISTALVPDCRSLERVFDALVHLTCDYPTFESWFYEIVIPGVRTGTRGVLVREMDERIVGVAITKRTICENKLSTLWVAPENRTLGLASDLAEDAFQWLETSRPLFSVPENKIESFASLISRWDFYHTQTLDDFYVKGSKEYVFNGILKQTN